MRRIVCKTCGQKWIAASGEPGTKQRFIPGIAKKPGSAHGVTVNGAFTPMPELVCDDCAAPLPPGTPCVCVSIWPGERGEMGPWEPQYVTPQSV